MSVVREKAQAFTKQLVGQMVGDELLVKEGKEQQEHAQDQREAPSPPKPSEAPPGERRER